MLVWKILPTGGVDENPVGEVELDQNDNVNQLKFKMKSGVAMNAEGTEAENLVMMS